jgi:Fe-S cluster biogenesis protein NfuA
MSATAAHSERREEMSVVEMEPFDSAPNAPADERIRELVEVLSSYIERYHGGAIEFVEYDGETLRVKMLGSCVGCPLAGGTIHGWIEGNVRQFFPELKTVEAITE